MFSWSVTSWTEDPRSTAHLEQNPNISASSLNLWPHSSDSFGRACAISSSVTVVRHLSNYIHANRSVTQTRVWKYVEAAWPSTIPRDRCAVHGIMHVDPHLAVSLNRKGPMDITHRYQFLDGIRLVKLDVSFRSSSNRSFHQLTLHNL